MKLNLSFSQVALASGLALALASPPPRLFAQTQSASPAESNHRVDNSAQNVAQGKTADQQLNDKRDVQITQEIRKALIADHSLSMYGHNIKIITRNGAVTLSGPVHSAQEKQAILSDAHGVVGTGKISDRITVKGGAKPSATNPASTQ